MAEQTPDGSDRKPLWNSGRAWALVLGGMVLIGATNLYVAFRSMPDEFDQNWRYADAGVAQPPAPVDASTPNPTEPGR